MLFDVYYKIIKKLVLLTKLSLKLSILFLNFIKNSLHKITIYIEFTGKMHIKEQHKKGRNRESETERRNKNLWLNKQWLTGHIELTFILSELT